MEIRLRNRHRHRIVTYARPSNFERSEIYFSAAYDRIFFQGIKGGCEALSFAAKNNLYQTFTGARKISRKYKKVYSVLYPEFMLFEKKISSTGYWFSYGEEGKEERIFAFLLCREMSKDPQ